MIAKVFVCYSFCKRLSLTFQIKIHVKQNTFIDIYMREAVKHTVYGIQTKAYDTTNADMRILSTRSEKKNIEATICKNVHVCIPCSARDTHSKVTHSHSNFPLANNHHHNRCSCRLIFSCYGCRQRKCPAKMNLKFLRFHNECMYGCHIQCQNVVAATVAVESFFFFQLSKRQCFSF